MQKQWWESQKKLLNKEVRPKSANTSESVIDRLRKNMRKWMKINVKTHN